MQIVTAAVYEAADPGGAGHVETDVVAAYAQSPGYNTKALYKMVKKLRDKQAGADAQKALGSVLIPAGGAAAFVDGETMTLTDATGASETYEFDVTGDGVAGGNVVVDISAGENQAGVATALAAAVNGGSLAITADGSGGTSVLFAQDEPGTAGNTAINETVSDAAFSVTDFSGGTDTDASGGTVGLKNSKNDTGYRAYLVPQDHANAIDL